MTNWGKEQVMILLVGINSLFKYAAPVKVVTWTHPLASRAWEVAARGRTVCWLAMAAVLCWQMIPAPSCSHSLSAQDWILGVQRDVQWCYWRVQTPVWRAQGPEEHLSMLAAVAKRTCRIVMLRETVFYLNFACIQTQVVCCITWIRTKQKCTCELNILHLQVYDVGKHHFLYTFIKDTSVHYSL